MVINLPLGEMMRILVQDYLHDHCNCHTLSKETHGEKMEKIMEIFNYRIVAPIRITNELNEVFSKQIQRFDVLDSHTDVDRKCFEDCNKVLTNCGSVITFCYRVHFFVDTWLSEEKILSWANEEIKKIDEFASEEFESENGLLNFCSVQLELYKKKIETTCQDMEKWAQTLTGELQQQVEELRQQLVEKEQQLENKGVALAEKDAELQRKNAELEKMKTELEKKEAELQESEERVQRLQDQARELGQQLGEVQDAARKNLEALKQQLEGDLENKEVALAEKGAELERKDAALQESEERVRDIGVQLKGVQEAAQDLKQQLDEKDAALKEAQKKTCCCPFRALLQKIDRIFTLFSLYVFQGFSTQMFRMRSIFALHV